MAMTINMPTSVKTESVIFRFFIAFLLKIFGLEKLSPTGVHERRSTIHRQA
jgi:hypothetical protein